MLIKVYSLIGCSLALPVIAQLDAVDTVERLSKGTAQVVLSVVVVCLALAIIQIFRYHRTDMLDAKKELKDEMEKSQKLIADNTSAMNMQSESNKQLKEAIYHLSSIVDKYRTSR